MELNKKEYEATVVNELNRLQRICRKEFGGDVVSRQIRAVIALLVTDGVLPARKPLEQVPGMIFEMPEHAPLERIAHAVEFLARMAARKDVGRATFVPLRKDGE